MSARTVDGVHWPDLDGLRALAILLVLGRHSLRPFISEDMYQSVVAIGSFDMTPLVLNGWVGVDLFFVLSGFLIGRQAWRGGGLARFWFKRATRILPAYWTCLAIIGVGLTMGNAWPRAGADFLAHLVMLQDYTGSSFVPAFWSLGAEEKFYLLAPFFVFAIARISSVGWQGASLLALWLLPVVTRAVLAADLTTPLSYNDYFFRYRSPFHLTSESLVLGFAIAWLSRNGRINTLGRPLREVLFWGGAANVLFWMAPGVILSGIGVGTIVWAPALIGVGFGAMVLSAVAGEGSYSLCFGWSGWRPIAIGSYTLYLTHMMVIPIATALAQTYPLTARLSITQQWVAFLPWYLALAGASAFLLHAFVEKPVLDWRERYVHLSSAPPVVALTP